MENTENSPENNLTVFNDWIKNLCEKGEVRNVDPQLVRGVLEPMGANFENLTEAERKSLRKYSNKGKRVGLHTVWGKDKVDTFKKWAIEEYIPFVEKRAGRELHTLWDPKTETYDNIKHSGMMQFLGELTAFAAGELPLEEYKRLTEDRIKKGKKWEYGDRYEPYKPSKHASFPVDFPHKAMDWLSAVI
jgi:hypothetical protein